MLAPGTPTATDGGRSARGAEGRVQLLPKSEVSEVLDRSNLQHPLDGQGFLGDIVA